MHRYQVMYKKLEKLGVIEMICQDKETARSEVGGGFMDLCFYLLRVVRHEEYDEVFIALAQNYIQNGDLMVDPNMEVWVLIHDNPDTPNTAEALTFLQANPPIYQRVYTAKGTDMKFKRRLNTFLSTWLSSALAQGHSFKGIGK